MNLLRYLSSFYQANEKYYNMVHYVHESFLNILILFAHLTKILNENSKAYLLLQSPNYLKSLQI